MSKEFNYNFISGATVTSEGGVRIDGKRTVKKSD
jgi:hypothetical protein